MSITIKSENTPLESLTTSLLVLVTSNEAELKGEIKISTQKKVKGSAITISEADKFFNSNISEHLKKSAVKKDGKSLIRWTGNKSIPSILVVGFPEEKNEFEKIEKYRLLGAAITKAAASLKADNIAISPANLDLNQTNAEAFIEGLILAGYKFEQCRGKKAADKTAEKEIIIKTVNLLSTKKFPEKAIIKGAALAEATIIARDLVNLPANFCTPDYLVEEAKKIAKTSKLGITVHNKEGLKKLGAGGLLCVAAASEFSPYLVKLVYRPANATAKTKVISLVGKGVTFDCGGLNIKTGTGMDGMKGDMAGAACVLASMKAIAELKPNCEVRGYLAIAENMISDEAMRVGDVYTAMNGKTFEIDNTDAEGRLILADALSLACKEGCNTVIDLATLTGACIVALGLEIAGVFSDSDSLVQQIEKAGVSSGERFWRMPLYSNYRKLLKSSVADMKNSGGRWGGAITAALFLKEFVTEDVKWAHIDIAGPADSGKDSAYGIEGGAGFGVRSMVRVVMG